MDLICPMLAIAFLLIAKRQRRRDAYFRAILGPVYKANLGGSLVVQLDLGCFAITFGHGPLLELISLRKWIAIFTHQRRKTAATSPVGRTAQVFLLRTITVKNSTKAPRAHVPLPYQSAPTTSAPSPLPCLFPSPKQVHAWIDMLTVAQPYFESHDFRGNMVLYAAFSHPLLKHLIRFERGLDRLMCTDNRTGALSRYFEPRIYQRDHAHVFTRAR
jgi:hypothetical protein